MPRQLIVIGGGLMQLPVLRLAKQQGIVTVCFDGSSKAPGRNEADRFVLADIKDHELCLRQAQAQAKQFGVDGVMTVGTDFSTTVAWIADHLKLAGHSYEAAQRARDKGLMRQTLTKAGLPSPRFKVLDAPGPLPDFFPCVVKPVDNMGARGVRLVNNPLDWETALAAALSVSLSGRAIVEEYIDGPEFSLDALIQGGQFHRMGLADRHIFFPPHFVELGHTFPSKVPPEQVEALWQLLEDAARALGLDQGAVKGDLKWSAKGPVIGEVAARLSGGFMSGWTYPLHSGVSAIEGAIKIALGETFQPRPENLHEVVFERAFFTIPGCLKEVLYADEVKSAQGVRELFFHVGQNSMTKWPENNVEKIANVIIAGSDYQAAEATAKNARLTLQFLLECPNPATEAFFANSQAPWWFEKAHVAAGQPVEGWENWIDAYGISAGEWKTRLTELELWPTQPEANFWRYFFQGGATGVRYFRSLSQRHN